MRALILAVSLISCSHILITVHPPRRNRLLCDLAKATLRLIFLSQYLRLVAGNFLRQVGQPCQKQPSINTAIRWLIKATSGLPVICSTFLFHPFNPIPASIAHRRFSSLVPLPLTACIVRRRSAAVRLSAITFLTGSVAPLAICVGMARGAVRPTGLECFRQSKQSPARRPHRQNP